MGLTESFEIPRINLSFDYDNFVMAEIVHGPSRFREVTFVLFNLIVIIGKREVTII